MEPPNPTAAHKACIAELLLRFPCPRDTEPEAYEARASLLAKDCSALQPGLLRKACDRAAQSARGLPYAAEILGAARSIVEERQAAQMAEPKADGQPAVDNLTASLIARNLELISSGFRHAGGEIHRWVSQNGRPELVRCSGRGAKARCNGDGTVSMGWWSDQYRDWVFSEGGEPSHPSPTTEGCPR